MLDPPPGPPREPQLQADTRHRGTNRWHRRTPYRRPAASNCHAPRGTRRHRQAPASEERDPAHRTNSTGRRHGYRHPRYGAARRGTDRNRGAGWQVFRPLSLSPGTDHCAARARDPAAGEQKYGSRRAGQPGVSCPLSAIPGWPMRDRAVPRHRPGSPGPAGHPRGSPGHRPRIEDRLR